MSKKEKMKSVPWKQVETSFFLLLYSALVAVILFYSTIYVYDINGQNVDDKTLLFSTSGAFYPSKRAELESLKPKIMDNCEGDKTCRWRTNEQLNAYNNYLFYAAIVFLLDNVGLYDNSPDLQRIPLIYTSAFFLQPVLIYLIGAVVLVYAGRTGRLLILLSLLGVVFTDKFMMNSKLQYLFDLLPDYLLSYTYLPSIYVPRGSSGLAFMMALACLVSGQRKTLALLVLLLPLIHLGYSMFLCFTVFACAASIFLLERDWKSFRYLLFLFAVSILVLYLNFVSILPMVGDGLNVISPLPLAEAVVTSINSAALLQLGGFGIFVIAVGCFLFWRFQIVWVGRVAAIALMLHVALFVFQGFEIGFQELYAGEFDQRTFAQLYIRMSGVMGIPASVLTLFQLAGVFCLIAVVFWKVKLPGLVKVPVLLLLAIVAYPKVSDMNLFYYRGLVQYVYFFDGFEDRYQRFLDLPALVKKDLELGINEDPEWPVYTFEEITQTTLHDIKPKNEVALSLAIYRFLTGKEGD